MSFTGQTVEIPVGQEGLTGTADPAAVRPGQLTMAQNVSYWSGVLRRESGATLLTPTPLGSPITGGLNWTPSANRTIVALADGRLLKDNGDGQFVVTLASGLAAYDMLPFFTEGGSETAGRPPLLFCALSPNPPRVIVADGNTADLIAPGNKPTEWATSGPSLFVLHEGRMWALGTGADPHRAWYSNPDDHTKYLDGVGGGNLSIFPGEGDRIVAAVSYKGILVVWKYPFGIYGVDTTEVDPNGWRVIRLSGYIGTRGPGCVAPLDNDIMFLDCVGNLQLMSGITEFGKMGTKNITESYDLGSTIRERYAPEKFRFTTMQFSPARREVHITMTTRGAEWPNQRIVADLNVPGAFRFRAVTRDLCGGLWLAPDAFGTSRPVVGGSDGRIWMLDQPGTTRGGIGWTPDDVAPSVWATGWMDLGYPVRRKLGKFIEVLLEVDTLVSMIIEVWWDGLLKQTITIQAGSVGARFDHAYFDQDRFVGPQSSLLSKRLRMVGSGRRLQLVGKSMGEGSDFGLARVFVQGDLSDERVIHG